MINYSEFLENVIKNIDKSNPPTLLLHSCCGPCSSYVLTYLSEYFKITVFYYNPNISPIEEYNERKAEQQKLIKELKSPNEIKYIEGDYDYDKFDKLSVSLEEEKEGYRRCSRCYFLRLNETAVKALELGFDYFTTTLSISPYKDSNKLNKIGKILENKYNVKYLYSDFKKKDGYKQSIELSKKYNLYRQNYCGCKYSKMERESYEFEK